MVEQAALPSCMGIVHICQSGANIHLFWYLCFLEGSGIMRTPGIGQGSRELCLLDRVVWVGLVLCYLCLQYEVNGLSALSLHLWCTLPLYNMNQYVHWEMATGTSTETVSGNRRDPHGHQVWCMEQDGDPCSGQLWLFSVKHRAFLHPVTRVSFLLQQSLPVLAQMNVTHAPSCCCSFKSLDGLCRHLPFPVCVSSCFR